MPKRLTEEEFKARLLVLHEGRVSLLGSYLGSKGRMRFLDVDYGEFEALGQGLMRGEGHRQRGLDRREQTMASRYPYEHPAQTSEVRDRRKATMLARYGVDNPTKSKEIVDRRTQNNLARHGVSNPSQLPESVERKKRTCVERYGTEWAFQNEGVKGKTKATLLDRYGVENPSHMSTFVAKMFRSKERNGTLRESRGEREMLEFVRTLQPDFEKGVLIDRNERSWEFDMISQTKKIAIEFNGVFWHSEANPRWRRGRHHLKSRIAESHGFSLIHIWETEWVQNRPLVESYLSARLGVFSERIPARRCEVCSVNPVVARVFLTENHLRGSATGTHLGLYLGDRLVALATLSKHPRDSSVPILSRFCSLRGVQVVGGLGRLSRHLANLAGSDLLSWQDVRLGTTNAYTSSGWAIEERTPPDYLYWDSKKNVLVSKQSRKKQNVNTPEGMTEHQHALADGLFRIYDCGKIRLRFKR